MASIASSNSNGASVSYTYDSLNRLSTAVDSHLGTTTYTYDDASNVATATYPNGVQTVMAYDTLNRVTGVATSSSSFVYQLGPTGNKTSALELNGRRVAWNYDGIYRLTNEAITSAPSGKNGALSYTLDPVGNRTSDTSSVSGLAPVSGSFNADDELSAESYDQNGNVLTSGGKSFSYDAENHLTSMGGTVALLYDGDGNRVAKSVNGVVTRYLVDDLNSTGYPQVVDELVGGSVQRTYTYGLQRIAQDQVISNTWTPSYYGYDGFGSVRNLTNTAGVITDSYDYDAFGNKINSTGTTPNNYLYRGEQFDTDLGLYYLRARYYNPLTGEFMSRDPNDGEPNDPASLHKYLYADDDPVNRLDPSGSVGVLDPPTTRVPVSAVEYALIVADISLGTIAAVRPVAAEVNCILYAAASALGAISGKNLGFVQTLHVSWSTCSAKSFAPRPTILPQPCSDNIGNCVPWAKGHRKPGDEYIHYKTFSPAPTCTPEIGERIFAVGLGGAVISQTGFHVGLLRNGIVYDNIYPGGISVDAWVGSVYEVPAECPLSPANVVTFDEAQQLGIGKIWVSGSFD